MLLKWSCPVPLVVDCIKKQGEAQVAWNHRVQTYKVWFEDFNEPNPYMLTGNPLPSIGEDRKRRPIHRGWALQRRTYLEEDADGAPNWETTILPKHLYRVVLPSIKESNWPKQSLLHWPPQPTIPEIICFSSPNPTLYSIQAKLRWLIRVQYGSTKKERNSILDCWQ